MQDTSSKRDITRYTQSSSFKMAMLFTVLLGAASLLLSYFLYDVSHQNFTRETEAAIDSEIKHILLLTGEYDPQKMTNTIRERSVQSAHPLYLYRDRDGGVLAGNINATPDNVERITEGVLQFTTDVQSTQRSVAAKIHTFPDGSTLLVARDIHDIIKSHNRLQIFASLIMGLMLIVVLVSFFISVFVVGRINIIARTARSIMETGDLSKRISIDTNWDDLSSLAQTLNALLSRIEDLMQGIRDVSDSIAHDLRTPLTRLRNRLEDAKTIPPSQAGIDKLLGEADHLLATFNALLRISNLEKGAQHQHFEPVDLAAVIDDAITLYDPLAEEKDIRIDLHLADIKPGQGDRDFLFQLFANLIDNALKFSPAGSTLLIKLEKDNKSNLVTIADQGIGIATEEKDRVFDRFYRSDKSRHTKGSGLGLSLVKAIVDTHNGTLKLSDNHPGLRVEISLPH